MVRVKNSVVAKTRHKKIIQKAKGYYSARSRAYRVAFQAIIKSGQYEYRDRRQKKRQFRRIWIIRINAAARENGMSYSNFIRGLKLSCINLNRKILAHIAVIDKTAFSIVAEQVKNTLYKRKSIY